MEIKRAEFLTSAADNLKRPLTDSYEIAVAGKSNVGKSSFINFLCNRGGLAKTSSTPGRTRLLNYFSINDGQFYLVDLPGYGFAKVSEKEKRAWSDLAEGYFSASENLKNVFLLVDIRHEPSPLDLQMVAYLSHYNLPFTVIATKADKLSRAQIARSVSAIAASLRLGADNVIAVSSSKKTGRTEVLARIEQILEN